LSDREGFVFRPSYILGSGNPLLPVLVEDIARGVVEIVGDGAYRLQPVAVGDAVTAILEALKAPAPFPRVVDLVGPEPLTYQSFVERVGARLGRVGYVLRSISVSEAERQAEAGGYRGLLRDELDCLLCDEVADPRPLEALLGGGLTPVEGALDEALRGLEKRPS
jgi:uncharacterized protein YbjT (DUF2867 family)